MKTNLLFIILLLVPSIFPVYGQEKERHYTNTIEAGVLGSIFIQNDEVEHLEQSLPWGVEASWVMNTYGKNHWQQVYNYPDLGAAFNYWDFQNDEDLGKLFGLMGIMNFYPFRKGKHNFMLRSGFGLALTTKHFTRDNNKNIAIGNTLSYMVQGAIGYSFKLTDRARFQPMVAITHISNGAYVIPNFGLNMVSIYVKGTYRIEKETPEYKKHELSSEDWKEGVRVNIVPAIGAKEIDPPLGDKYIVLALTAYADKRLARVSAVNAGLDFIYNQAVDELIERDPNLQGDPTSLRLGALVGHELFLNRLSIITQLGLFLWRDYEDSKSPFYVRLGLKFYLTKNLFISVTLKTEQFDTSDYVRYGIGYRF
jgi:hypothetical protein